MEWLVIDVIYMKGSGRYGLILHASSLKMMVEATSEYIIQPGDILYPTTDAMYQINKNEQQHLKVINASAFSATQWSALKTLSGYQTVTANYTDL